jgi:hypothetical protein
MVILTPNGDEVSHTARRREADERNAGAVPRLVQWSIFLQEGKCRDDPANIAESDLPCAANRATVMATKIHGKPTYYNWHGGVAAACNKEKCRILQLQIIRPRQQNSEPNDADSDWDQCEKKPMSQPIRGPGDQHRKHKGRSPWWHGVELCLNRGISISSDDARCEVCISICLKAAC